MAFILLIARLGRRIYDQLSKCIENDYKVEEASISIGSTKTVAYISYSFFVLASLNATLYNNFSA